MSLPTPFDENNEKKSFFLYSQNMRVERFIFMPTTTEADAEKL